MTLFLGFAAIAAIAIYVVFQFSTGNVRQLVRVLRWILGGGALALAAIFGVTGRVSFASVLGMVGAAILWRGRLGPIDFTNGGTQPGANSQVRSSYFEMELDHDTGAIAGIVTRGHFSGHDLFDLGQEETGQLLDEVERDTDSRALLEAWLDANRKGWRDYFPDYAGGSSGSQEQASSGRSQSAGPMTENEALDILGLNPGAGPDDIKAAHHRLLKAVHPDQGGSTFLAARINEARDFLLGKAH